MILMSGEKRVPYFRQPMVVISLLACSSLLSLSVNALPFSIGSVEGQFETELSIKNNWSTTKPDHNLIGMNNGGRGFSQINDDGRLNFKKGDSFSRLFKGKHHLHLKYNNYGLVLSGQYWYDFVEKNQRQPFNNINDSGRYMGSRAAGAEWQEAFVYHNYQLADKQGTVRLGRQILNWGEERLIDGGINVINPIDTRWGWQSDLDTRAERMPVSLLSFSQQLTDSLSTEFFYQLDWRPTTVSNCGSFFSNSDITTHGCTDNLRALRSSSALSNSDLNALSGININSEGVMVRREKDRRAKAAGQFGFALHYYFEPIQADLGFYFINYHSRISFINGRTANQAAINQAAGLGGLAPEWLAGNSSYFLDYPENIHLYGVSFSKDLRADLSWRGELSYRPNMPVQINPVELFKTVIGQSVNVVHANQKIKGYERKQVTQLQTSLTKTANGVMGAEEFKLTGALGMSYVAGLGSKTLYGRDAVFGASSNCSYGSRYCEKNGFTTGYAWGYRIRGEWEYRDVWAPRLSLKPSISWLHDVQGYSPSNEAVFVEGRKAVTVGLTAEYLRTYSVGLNYTNFFGGRYNTWADRDFVSLEMGLKF